MDSALSVLKHALQNIEGEKARILKQMEHMKNAFDDLDNELKIYTQRSEEILLAIKQLEESNNEQATPKTKKAKR